jgi:hypothetical protein
MGSWKNLNKVLDLDKVLKPIKDEKWVQTCYLNLSMLDSGLVAWTYMRAEVQAQHD